MLSIQRHKAFNLRRPGRLGVAAWFYLLSFAFLTTPSVVDAKKRDGASKQVAIEDLHPTQSVVESGRLDRKARKLAKAGSDPAKFDAVLAKKPVEAVIGPGGKLYITNGHHRTTAAKQSGASSVRVKVTEDLSGLSNTQFWNRLEATGRAQLVDPSGRRLQGSQLPSNISGVKTVP